MSAKIDSIDLKILQKLQEDGRKTNLQLSQEIGLSPAPTLERVKKLEKNKIIRSYHAVVNEDILGIGINAIVQVSVSHQMKGSLNQFKDSIMKFSEVTECLQVTGSFDYQLRVKVKDIDAFNTFIQTKMSEIGVIRQMQTFVILSTVKNAKVLPISYK